MNFYSYIGATPEIVEAYLAKGLLQRQHHKEFPLDIYVYGREAVHENVWDNITSRCRGIIVNRETGEVVARPFEKFHNFGSTQVEHVVLPASEPAVFEKVDGFMCTQYTWAGKHYIASKGSFHSIHAKWATAELQRHEPLIIPSGWTPVFEGLHPDLRIVVDYGKAKELVLLAMINIETGEEMRPSELHYWGVKNGFRHAELKKMSLEEAKADSWKDDHKNEEGYVLTWYPDADAPPFRLKLKFIDYLRIHRMVTGVSPKRVWEVLATRQESELKDYLAATPWFNEFVTKWMKALNGEYERIAVAATTRYAACREICRVKVGQYPYKNLGEERKAYALEFNRPENKEFAPVLFALLDGKDIAPVIWKRVRAMTVGANPMVDGHNF